MEVKFTIHGVPVGKGRPRFTSYNGRVNAITPTKTVNYENLVKLSYSIGVGQQVLNGAIKAKIMAFFPIPKSTSKKKRAIMEAETTPHPHKPDADNVIKAILDALNGIAYHDDSQVVSVTLEKFYSENPRAEVTLTEIEEV